MTEQRGRLGHDVLGLVLFGLAAFTGVSVAMAMGRPVSEGNETTALVVAVVRGIGALPGALLCLGLVVLGARLWLWGVAGGLGRHLLGLVGASLALSVLAGAMAPGAGGALGAVGELVSRQGTLWLGVPFGLLVLALPLWFAWVRPRVLAPAGFSQDEEPPDLEPADAAHVSPAEADALLPEGPPWGGPLSSSEKLPEGARETGGSVRSTYRDPSLPPLYPEDVRRKGGIPEGATPLENPHETPLSERPAAPGGARGHAPLHQPSGATGAVEPERPGADLAADAGAQAHRAGGAGLRRGPAAAAPQPLTPASEAELPAPTRDQDDQAPAAAPVGEEDPAPHAAVPLEREVDPEPAAQAEAPPRPSWEQPGLFDEEPVDAYGTPVSLVERLRRANQETRRAVQGADLEDAATEEAAAEADAEDERIQEAAQLGEDVDAALDTELDDEPEAERTAEDDGENDADERLAVSGEDAQDDAPEQDEQPEETPSEVRDVLVPAAKAAAPEEAAAAPPEASADDAERDRREATPRRRADPRPRKAPAAAEAVLDADDLVYRAGLLFLERQRVAVSMLQREFGLDFKQATDLLDRLQEAGLIGPYLGGKRRDILLTPEQWRERVGVS